MHSSSALGTVRGASLRQSFDFSLGLADPVALGEFGRIHVGITSWWLLVLATIFNTLLMSASFLTLHPSLCQKYWEDVHTILENFPHFCHSACIALQANRDQVIRSRT